MKYRVHIIPVIVEACSRFEAKAKAIHLLLDDDSLLLVDEAKKGEKLTPVPESFRKL